MAKFIMIFKKILKKLFKIILFLFLTAVLLLGIYAALVYFHVITPPAFMPALPYIQEKTTKPVDKRVFELEKVKQENDILKKRLSNQEAENELLKNDMKELEDKKLAIQKATQKADEEYKTKIIALNNKLSSSKQNKADQESAYKDMAKYFIAMKTKDGAELLAKLDETDAIGILEKIDTETAAELIQKMPKDKAASITRKMLVTTPQE